MGLIGWLLMIVLIKFSLQAALEIISMVIRLAVKVEQKAIKRRKAAIRQKNFIPYSQRKWE